MASISIWERAVERPVFFGGEEGCQRHPLQFSGRLDVNPARSADLLGLRETPTHLLNKPTRYLSIADNSSED